VKQLRAVRLDARQLYTALVVGAFAAFVLGVALNFGLGWALMAGGLPMGLIGLVGLGLTTRSSR